MIEVDARPGEGGPPERSGAVDVLAGEDDEAALRAATAPPDPDRDEGFGAPAMRRIVEQSEPFAELLQDAEQAYGPPPAAVPPVDEASTTLSSHDWDAWSADLPGADAFDVEAEEEDDEPPVAPPPPPTYAPPAGPRAAAAYGRPPLGQLPAAPPSAPPPPPAPDPSPATEQPPSPVPAEAVETVSSRPAPAAAHVSALVARGLPAVLAEAVVDEAVAHAAPFAGGRPNLKKLVRATLARRLPVQGGFGGAGRTIALVGPAGGGKTRAAAGLAAAYAGAGRMPVVVLTLRPRDVGAELVELLDPHGVAARPVEDGAAARAHIGTRAGTALVLLDTPAVSPRDREGIARLAGDLRDAGVTETHVVLPATVAGPVAAEALSAFTPLGPSAVLLTHADETDHLGPLVALAIAEGRPLSYVSSGPAVGADLLPADPAALAARLLP
jgi:hypothetical protein